MDVWTYGRMVGYEGAVMQWIQWVWSSCGLRLMWRYCVIVLMLCCLPVVALFHGLRFLFLRCPTCVFFAQWLRSPTQVGAIFPSSIFLARKIALVAQAIDCSGYVVELGAGLGAVTTQLLKSGIPRERLIVIERSPLMVAHLRSRFPGLAVIEGDAASLSDYLKDYLGSVELIVSSLPLRSLSHSKRISIFYQLQLLLSGSPGFFIQYTYALGTLRSFYPDCFRSCSNYRVWANIPPARVECFSINDQCDSA